MKKSLLTLSLLSLFFISTGAFSDEITNDTKNFKGLNLGFGLSVVKYKSTYDESLLGDWGVQLNYQSTNVVPRFDGSYLFALDDKWLFGAGLSFDLSPFNGETYDLSRDPAAKTKIRTMNHFSLYLQPTYAISSSLAIFGKLSYQSSNISAIWICPDDRGCFNDRMRLHGVGVGLGVKKMITQSIYLQVEGEYVGYVGKTVYIWGQQYVYKNNSSSSGTISVGYHF